MLRFKQFLLIEGDFEVPSNTITTSGGNVNPATITQRKYLESVYGKENAEIMFSKIREREAELGGKEQHLKYINQIPIEQQKQKDQQKEQQKVKDKLPGLGLNPDLVGPMSGAPISDSDVESRARAVSGMNDTQINTFNTFAPPNYSDKNLDRPIDVNVIKMEPHPSLVAAGWAAGDGVPAASGGRSGDRPENERGEININKDLGYAPYSRTPKDIYDLVQGKWFKNKATEDLIGHELTHTGQTEREYSSSTRSPLPQTEYNSNEPASKETTQRRTYTQNAYEPAARMSEIKHIYHNRTGKLLPADMTPEDKTNFQSWYNTTKDVQNPGMDDTMQLLDTPEGDELFRRTAKVTKPDTSDTRMT